MDKDHIQTFLVSIYNCGTGMDMKTAKKQMAQVQANIALADALAKVIEERFFSGCGPKNLSEYCIEECDMPELCQALAAYRKGSQ